MLATHHASDADHFVKRFVDVLTFNRIEIVSQRIETLDVLF